MIDTIEGIDTIDVIKKGADWRPSFALILDKLCFFADGEFDAPGADFLAESIHKLVEG